MCISIYICACVYCYYTWNLQISAHVRPSHNPFNVWAVMVRYNVVHISTRTHPLDVRIDESKENQHGVPVTAGKNIEKTVKNEFDFIVTGSILHFGSHMLVSSSTWKVLFPNNEFLRSNPTNPLFTFANSLGTPSINAPMYVLRIAIINNARKRSWTLAYQEIPIIAIPKSKHIVMHATSLKSHVSSPVNGGRSLFLIISNKLSAKPTVYMLDATAYERVCARVCAGGGQQHFFGNFFFEKKKIWYLKKKKNQSKWAMNNIFFQTNQHHH